MTEDWAKAAEAAKRLLDATKSDTPNPGSDEAMKMGCLCPVLDNNHGKHLPWTGGWWVNEDCPVHVAPKSVLPGSDGEPGPEHQGGPGS